VDKRDFFNNWTDSYRITRETIEAFPEDKLGEVIIPGLRPPGELFCHIFAHVNAIFNACVRRELNVDELYLIPSDVDTTKQKDLLRFARRTMEGLLAHASVNADVWKQQILTPGGEVPMDSMCLESFAHEVHHRGQLTAMLRVIGIEAPKVCLHERI
jgi:uncharacterized damage-inducible protein DinB